jgi:peptidoglycan hydrolase-like protein with peptidoglycan-binding domain
VLAGVAVVVFVPIRHDLTTALAANPAAHTVKLPPLHVVSVTPGPGTRDVSGVGPVRVVFSAALAANSPMPELTPSVAGSWQRDGDAAVFTPATGFTTGTSVKVRIPAGTSGVRSAAGNVLAAETTAHFTTGRYSLLRMQQILAQLGYLPLSWNAILGGTVTPGSAAAQLAAAYAPPAGDFTWSRGYPGGLHSFWHQGSGNLITTGAIMAFENDHGMQPDGLAGPAVWKELLRAATQSQDNQNGYTYAIADQTGPETLTIWHDGREVFRNYANTGIPVAPTPIGTFPVYERLRYQIMQGTNPDGSHYADPVQFVAYFSGGAAVHYFPRGSYGWQQSLGCVELPLGPAAEAWPYLTYGSLVTVTA